MELVYRLAVEETPFIRNIRDNVITLITPVLEVDGRNRRSICGAIARRTRESPPRRSPTGASTSLTTTTATRSACRWHSARTP